MELNVLELLEYLNEIIEDASKIPMTGKVAIDKKDCIDTIDQIINYLPDQLKRATWVMNEKDRIINEAKKESDNVKKESIEIMKQSVENHDIVREAKAKANEIIAQAQRDAKAIRIGSRDYSNEILLQMDIEIENRKIELIKSMQDSFEVAAKAIDKNLSNTSSMIKENIAELRSM